MKYCSNCGKTLDSKDHFCQACGAEQKPLLIVPDKSPGLPAIIVTLAVITLLGSAFGIIRGVFYQTFAGIFQEIMDEEKGYNRGYILMFLNIGTFAAAILMLRMKRIGYYIYLIAQAAYLGFTLYVTFIYSDGTENILNPFILLTSALFLAPSGILLILFLTIARKYFIRNS